MLKIPKYIIFATSLFLPVVAGMALPKTTMAASCPKLNIVFARGSGAEKDTNDNFLEFKKTIEEKIGGFGISHQYIDLDYPAVGVNDPEMLLSAFFGAGEANEFGASVEEGASNLLGLVETCPDTKFVIGGYSQGAIVVDKALPKIASNKIIYAATFGDPKIYLPEGKTSWTIVGKSLLKTSVAPEACRGKNLSNYRMYVPDCYAYEGLLGSYQPYQPFDYLGKLGVWCNKQDIFCSSYLSVKSHVSYVADGLYEDASRVIANKIAEAFNIKNKFISTHDTAILIDSTGSMGDLINKYKAEALDLAKKTLENGGRVALYDYRDLKEGYEPKEGCNFETCDLESFEVALEQITTDGGEDENESLLSASVTVMKKLNWQLGATKSLVVLTDAGYHNPDIDGIGFEDVVNLSKSIDPVNFYIITPPKAMSQYRTLAAATDGAVVSSAGDLSELTNTIMTRYDSLPRVEEENIALEVPELSISEIIDNGTTVTVRFKNGGNKAIVALNDAILGVTQGDSVTISELSRSVSNVLRLTPMGKNRKGPLKDVEIKPLNGYGAMEASIVPKIPKAPNTGRKF